MPIAVQLNGEYPYQDKLRKNFRLHLSHQEKHIKICVRMSKIYFHFLSSSSFFPSSSSSTCASSRLCNIRSLRCRCFCNFFSWYSSPRLFSSFYSFSSSSSASKSLCNLSIVVRTCRWPSKKTTGTFAWGGSRPVEIQRVTTGGMNLRR